LLTSHCIRPDDDAQVTVSCSGRQGALLSLPLSAACEDTAAQGDFGKWLVKNIDCCMQVAENSGLGVNRMEDIILVTGRHLARSWVNVVFSESRGGTQLSFIVQTAGNSGVHLEERSATGGDLKLGPSGEVVFCTIFRLHPCLISDTRTYPRTNAYSSEGTVSSGSYTDGQDFGDWRDLLPICLNLTSIRDLTRV